MKIIWILAFLVFFAACIWNIVTTIQSHISWPTYWDIQYVQEIPINFPAITICNRKLLDTSKNATKTWIAKNLQFPSGPHCSIFNNYTRQRLQL